MKYIKNFEAKKLDINSRLIDCARNKASLNEMRELLKNGADPNYIDYTGYTPLMEACRFYFYSGVKLLLENGAKINYANEKNLTAFYILSAYSNGFNYMGNEKNIKIIVNLLIEYGADLYIKPYIGKYWDEISSDKFIEYIKNKYPDSYNDFIIKKESDKYNI